jgi:capsular polysaccharide biosynthesis protein
MVFQGYWRILRRRWLLVVIPAAVVLALGLATYRRPPPLYNVGVRFIAGQAPSSGAATSDEERLANWQTAEYIVDTLGQWVRGGQFAELVSQQLAQEGIAVPAPEIQAGVTADNTRSILILYMNYGDPAVLEAMMNAGAAVLIERNALGLPQLGGEPAELVQLDRPIVNRVPAGILDQLDLPIRAGLALAAGIGLALLVDYLDPTVRGREELEKLGLEIVGVIPKGSA